MIKLIYPSKDIEPDIKEIFRYMGQKTYDDNLLKEVLLIKDEVLKNAQFLGCFKETELSLSENGVNFGIGEIKSVSLLKNLTGCEKTIVFCATSGANIDRLISKYSFISPLKGFIANAVANTLIECFCDDICISLSKKYEKTGLYLRPRFSPGYGDTDLNLQKDFLTFLDATRKTGVSLTDGNMMVPSKSVTALMGISSTDEKCHISGCENCNKTNCNFRRN